ncbi:MAG: insulinase family protein [Gammaproteobacteria bacterium]|nr:insulinase family protein [Gammaproteobacteria bacterium]
MNIYVYYLFLAIVFMTTNPLANASSKFYDLKSSCHLLSPEQINSIQIPDIYYRQLSNGLKVYIYENHQQSTFALQLIVNVGASDELQGEGGYAHLFEHMMFKGSLNVPDGGHFDAIRNTGGQVNAFTDYDRTVYWTEASVRYLDRVLWLESERLHNLMINEEHLENQRQAVLEEKLLRIDNVPYFKIASEFMISAWQGTDYDHLIIGTEQEIKNSTVEQVKNFFDHYYRPDNITLVLVGDVKPEKIIKKLERLFANNNNKIRWDIKVKYNKFSMALAQDKTIKSSTKLKGKSESHFDPLAPFPLYALGWHTPGKNNPDFYAVELLADILLNHDASRLKQQLKEEQALVFETIGFPLTFEQAGITAMGMVPHSYATFSQIKSLVKNEIEKIHRIGVSSDELCSAKKHRQLMILKKMSNNRQMAGLIGDGAFFFNDPQQALNDLIAYQNVDNDMIIRVSRQYFNDDWLALEIVPGPGVRFVKWLMEILPRSLSQPIEQQFL